MFDARQLGNRVLLGRRQLGLDQHELARVSGVSRSRISEIERGKGSNVGIDAIYGLAQALGVTVPYLLGLTENELGEDIDRVQRELDDETLTIDVESKEQRRLLQEAIDALSALSPREQRRAVRLLRTMRDIEEDEGQENVPHIIG